MSVGSVRTDGSNPTKSEIISILDIRYPPVMANIAEGRSKTPSSSFSLWPRLLKETLGQVCKKARVAQERARASARRKVIPQLLVLNEFKMQAI